MPESDLDHLVETIELLGEQLDALRDAWARGGIRWAQEHFDTLIAAAVSAAATATDEAYDLRLILDRSPAPQETP